MAARRRAPLGPNTFCQAITGEMEKEAKRGRVPFGEGENRSQYAVKVPILVSNTLVPLQVVFCVLRQLAIGREMKGSATKQCRFDLEPQPNQRGGVWYPS